MREHVFRRHSTSTELIDSFVVKDVKERQRRLRSIRKNGMWAYVDVPEGKQTKGQPCIIHYWHRKDQHPLRVALMIGHELGHIADGGPKNNPGSKREEDRADEFARTTQETLTLMMQTGLLIDPRSAPTPHQASSRGRGRVGR